MQETKQYKYSTFLSLLYMTIMLSTVVLIYKVIKIGPIHASASTLIIPFWYYLGDVIAEVYGYKLAKNLIWSALACEFVFATLCMFAINMDSPPFWPNQEAYNQIFGNIYRVVTGSFIAIICGNFLNIYILSRWRILLHGRYFWLRSLGATTIGECIFTILAFTIEFWGVAPASEIMKLIAVSYGIKLAIAPIAVIPSSILAAILKKVEGIPVYESNTELNPFKLEAVV